MELINKQIGVVEYNENQIFDFSGGIFGFEELRKFLITKSEYKLINWLWAVEQPETVFPIIQLRLIHDKYPQLENKEAYGIIKLNLDVKKSTVNLKAPLYIDENAKKGFQKIIDKVNYPVDYKLFAG